MIRLEEVFVTHTSIAALARPSCSVAIRLAHAVTSLSTNEPASAIFSILRDIEASSLFSCSCCPSTYL
jgi:hypothetical protein